MFVCCCGASFQFLGQITSHKKKNCEWIYVCPHCDRVYKDFDKMSEHKKEHKKRPVQVPAPEPVSVPVVPTTLTKEEKNEKEEEAKPKDKDEEKKLESSEDVKADEVTSAKPGEVAKAKSDEVIEAKSDGKVDSKLDGKPNSADAPKKIELAHALVKPKLKIKPVEKKIPPHIRGRVPNQIQGNFMGNQMRPNMMPNQGMMNPQQNFMGGFNNQGMNFGMGMQPMMNMGMGNFGPMNTGMNMGNFGGFNMPNQFCGPNMGMMNMGGMNNMGMNNMGMNMGGANMGGMNMGMGMNMGGVNAPNMGGMNNGPNMGGMNSASNMMGMNMGSHVGGNAPTNQGGFNPAPGGKVTPGTRDQNASRLLILDKVRESNIDPPMRGRSISPSPRRGEDSRGSHGLSPPRRGLDKDRDSFRERDFRDRFDYRDDDSMDRLGSSDRKWKDDSRDRYSPSDRDRDRSDRGWPKRSMSREEFLSNNSSSFFSKLNSGSGVFAKNETHFDRNYSPRDDGPPGLGKLGFSGLQKRDNPDPHVISRPSKMMRPSEYL
uniref:C2H2-type domain-containing protein n=3 Tax=Lygus hesperus TaxID=30085 RepID=A0A0K8SBT8_LYGHE